MSSKSRRRISSSIDFYEVEVVDESPPQQVGVMSVLNEAKHTHSTLTHKREEGAKWEKGAKRIRTCDVEVEIKSPMFFGIDGSKGCASF